MFGNKHTQQLFANLNFTENKKSEVGRGDLTSSEPHAQERGRLGMIGLLLTAGQFLSLGWSHVVEVQMLSLVLK